MWTFQARNARQDSSGCKATATHCNIVLSTATHCNTLQHTATHCNTLQHTATHCNTKHETRDKVIGRCFHIYPTSTAHYVAVCCSVLQWPHIPHIYRTLCCSVLQCVAVATSTPHLPHIYPTSTAVTMHSNRKNCLMYCLLACTTISF